MTHCIECGVVDLGVTIVTQDEYEIELCPNCNAENSVQEIAESDWIEDMALEEGDRLNDDLE